MTTKENANDLPFHYTPNGDGRARCGGSLIPDVSSGGGIHIEDTTCTKCLYLASFPAPSPVAEKVSPLREGRSDAPWTKEQVRALEAWQQLGHVHPFTCECSAALIPTVRGWICALCDYAQTWAHSFMVDATQHPPSIESPEQRCVHCGIYRDFTFHGLCSSRSATAANHEWADVDEDGKFISSVPATSPEPEPIACPKCGAVASDHAYNLCRAESEGGDAPCADVRRVALASNIGSTLDNGAGTAHPDAPPVTAPLCHTKPADKPVSEPSPESSVKELQIADAEARISAHGHIENLARLCRESAEKRLVELKGPTVERCSHQFSASMAPCEQLERAHCNAERHDAIAGECNLIHHHAYKPPAPTVDLTQSEDLTPEIQRAPTVELSGERALELADAPHPPACTDMPEIVRYLREYARIVTAIKDPAAVHINILRGTIALARMQALHIAGATDYDSLRATIRQHEETIAGLRAMQRLSTESLEIAERTIAEQRATIDAITTDRHAVQEIAENMRRDLDEADRKNGELFRQRDDLRAELTTAESRIASLLSTLRWAVERCEAARDRYNRTGMASELSALTGELLPPLRKAIEGGQS